MSAAPGPVDATCPSCGAPLRFSVGSSRAAVCGYCHSLVTRKGQDFTAVGKVADLIPTGTRLALGLEGKLGAHGLRLVGRMQYTWAQGAWDEWYVALDDGRWGWLAEAQGRYYLTFPDKLPDVPDFADLEPGTRLTHKEQGSFVLTDRKRATIAGVEGELPSDVRVGDEARTADFQGSRSLFATVDYSDETPRFFIGREVLLEQLNLTAVERSAPARRGKAGVALECPNCRAPVQVRVPDQSVRVACEHCGALLDASKGAFQIIEVLEKQRSVPPIPLGTEGTLRGRRFQVVGWMRRSCVVDGETYDWQELLLYEPSTTGFAWLVLSDGHWQLAEPISAAEVEEQGNKALYKGKSHRFFSRVTGRVDEVLGEFYWAVQVNDTAELSDYTAPPNGLSREATLDELNWSYLTHLEAEELAAAFAKPGLKALPKKGVGTVQPYPFARQTSAILRWCGAGALGVLALWVVLAAQGRTLVYQHVFPAGELMSEQNARAPSTAPDNPFAPTSSGPESAPANPFGQHGNPRVPRSHAFLSEPFTLPSNRAVQVELDASVNQHWAYAAGALVPAQGGTSQVFGLEASYYSGSDSDGAWSEGERAPSASLSAPPAGDYVLRADLQWDPGLMLPPGMALRVYSGGTSGWQLIFAWLALLGPSIIVIAHRAAFEQARWTNSTVTGGSA